MSTIVDTSVWSLAFRRKAKSLSTQEQEIVRQLQYLISQGQVVVIGAIRQEILSGVAHSSQYIRLRDMFRVFPDLPLTSKHYEVAAHCFNKCRKQGIQGSNTDFLICAVAISEKHNIFSLDRDFQHYHNILHPSQLEIPNFYF